MQFILKSLSNNNIKNEISSIGFDKSYIDEAIKKHDFLSVKIFSLSCKQATIIKQSALSKGCDCALHRSVLDNSIEKSDCILSGTIKQLQEVCATLKKQPFDLVKLSVKLDEFISASVRPSPKSKIMGILNLTPNSFSDGGEFENIDRAINHAIDMIEQGADVIDIGAQSTRPNADLIGVELEINKVIPVLTALKTAYPNIELSVDTFNFETAKESVQAGCDIINDVSFLNDDRFIELCKNYNKKLVIMHSRGDSKSMDSLTDYDSIVDDIYKELYFKIKNAELLGLSKDNIIIDVGFGFAKTIEQNFKLLSHIADFKSLGCRILAGCSRKRFLQDVINTKEPKDADIQTVLSTSYLISQGIDYIRVHNVELNIEAKKFNERLFQELL